jgi:hypothetical protein
LTLRGLKVAATALLLVLITGLACASSASMKGPGEMARPAARNQQLAAKTAGLDASPSAAAATLYGYVSLYQKIFSTLKWSNCQFSPSCSHYAQEALNEHGALAGISMAGDRLIRCNRWAWDSGEYRLLSDGHLYDPISDQSLWADR